MKYKNILEKLKELYTKLCKDNVYRDNIYNNTMIDNLENRIREKNIENDYKNVGNSGEDKKFYLNTNIISNENIK